MGFRAPGIGGIFMAASVGFYTKKLCPDADKEMQRGTVG
jgi:hypothetical protein